jgi:Flp pilus assembly protein TadG
MSARHRHHPRQRGQSTVELLLLLPVVLLLFFGVYTAANFISDRQIAGQATRAGARLGAEMGNNQYQNGQLKYAGTCMASGTDPCIVDNAIVTSTLTVARGLSNIVSIDEIDVYEPCAAPNGTCSASTQVCSYQSGTLDGSLQANDPVDVYKPNAQGTFVLTQPAGKTQYTLDLRKQTHPKETMIGVRLVYTFKASAPMSFFNLQTSEYATMCLAPIQSGG